MRQRRKDGSIRPLGGSAGDSLSAPKIGDAIDLGVRDVGSLQANWRGRVGRWTRFRPAPIPTGRPWRARWA